MLSLTKNMGGLCDRPFCFLSLVCVDRSVNKSFGQVGVYERLIGKAYGAIDPRSGSNKLIQDVTLAPRNKAGLVEYVTDIEIIRPKNAGKGIGALLVEVPNRGNKTGICNFNAVMPGDLADLNALKSSGDRVLMKESGRCPKSVSTKRKSRAGPACSALLPMPRMTSGHAKAFCRAFDPFS